MKVSAEDFDDITYKGNEPFKVLQDTIVDKSRWSLQRTVVFEYKRKLWAIDYDQPATECQEGDSPDEYEAYRVEAYQTTAYRAVAS